MRLGQRIDVVGFVRVRTHPIHQRSVDGGSLDVGGENGCLRNPALPAYETDSQVAGSETRARNDGPHPVQYAMLGVQQNLGRQVAIPGRHHIPG